MILLGRGGNSFSPLPLETCIIREYLSRARAGVKAVFNAAHSAFAGYKKSPRFFEKPI